METIITLLIVLLPVVFKLIGKALENASQNQTVPHQQDVAPDFVEPAQEWPPYQRIVKLQEAVPEEHQEGESVVERPVAPVQTVQAVAEDKPDKEKKIDPKKLIVYSEIMKPKY